MIKDMLQRRLGFGERELTEIRHDMFYAYCLQWTGTDMELQTALVSGPLYRWFNREYARGEEAYCSWLSRYRGLMPIGKARETYYRYVSQVMDKYPKSILHDIRKRAELYVQKHGGDPGAIGLATFHFN